MRTQPRGLARLLALVSFGVLAVAVAGCEKPSHENIDRWRGTVKGPGKLSKALTDEDLDPELRAHAAQALISLEKLDEVEATISELEGGTKMAVLAKLIPRLWDDSKLAEELAMPTSKQLLAKDAMFALRAHSGP